MLSDPVQRMVYDEIHGYALTAVNPFVDSSSPKDHVFVDEFSCIGMLELTSDPCLKYLKPLIQAPMVSNTWMSWWSSGKVGKCEYSCGIFWQLRILQDARIVLMCHLMCSQSRKTLGEPEFTASTGNPIWFKRQLIAGEFYSIVSNGNSPFCGFQFFVYREFFLGSARLIAFIGPLLLNCLCSKTKWEGWRE